jgi:hypothetical protein
MLYGVVFQTGREWTLSLIQILIRPNRQPMSGLECNTMKFRTFQLTKNRRDDG